MTSKTVSSITTSRGVDSKAETSGLTRCLESAAQLSDSRRTIAEVFCREARQLDITGAALSLSDAGGTASTIYYGRRCSNGRTRVDDKTHFAIASLTKAATALVVLDLLDKNRRRSSEPIDDQGVIRPALSLLQHTAGSRAPTLARGAPPTRTAQGDPAPAPTWFDPEELWHYDNANYRELHARIEELGWGLDDAWRERFGEHGPRFSPRADGACDHTWVEGHPVPLPPPQLSADEVELAGGARATVNEVMELLAQVAAEPRMVATAVPTLEGDRYGLGLRISTAAGGRRQSWWHTGAGLGSWAWMRGDEEGRRASVLANRNIELAETVEAIEGHLFQVDPVEAPPRPPNERIVGEYRVRDWDQSVTVRVDAEQLKLDVPALGTSGVALQPDDGWAFRAHLPMQAGSQRVLFVESKGQIWLRSPWFVARKTDPP